MSEVKSDKLSPVTATTTTFGDSGDKLLFTTGTNLDMNGVELILDADADTSITADTDDQIDIRIAGADLKTHEWRLPKARTERLEEIRGTRNAKLVELDLEYQLADEGVHPDGSSKVQVAAKKVALRDLPPTAQSHLAGLNDTDAITAYDPVA